MQGSTSLLPPSNVLLHVLSPRIRPGHFHIWRSKCKSACGALPLTQKVSEVPDWVSAGFAESPAFLVKTGHELQRLGD